MPHWAGVSPVLPGEAGASGRAGRELQLFYYLRYNRNCVNFARVRAV
jgi:hypothetical protein